MDGKVIIEEYIRRLKEQGFGGMLVSDHNSYDVVIQDQQILLIYTLDSGYRFIFIYNVPMEQIAGMSLEKLSA